MPAKLSLFSWLFNSLETPSHRNHAAGLCSHCSFGTPAFLPIQLGARHGAAEDHVGHDQVLPERQQQRRPDAQHQRARAAVLAAEPARRAADLMCRVRVKFAALNQCSTREHARLSLPQNLRTPVAGIALVECKQSTAGQCAVQASTRSFYGMLF